MKLRIIKTDKGYVTQVQKSKWYGKKYWTHFCSVSGMSHEPWYYSTFDYALDGLIKKVRWDTLSESATAGTYKQ